MTVHASKGLQAPIVFLPDTRRSTFIPPKTYWPADKDGELFFWAPKKEWRTDLIRSQIETLKEKNSCEYNRLLYVALTRAADRLYITGWDKKKPSKENWYDLIKNGIEGKAQEIRSELFEEPVLRLTSSQDVPPKKKKQNENVLESSPLPDWISSPAPTEPTPPKPLAPSRPDVEEPAHLSPLTQGRIAAMKRGKIIHSLLEILPCYPENDRYTVAEKLVKTQMPQTDGKEQKQIINSVLKLIGDPLTAELFSSSSLPEVPVSGVVGNRVINGQIDRIAVYGSEILLADYKTGRSIPDSIEKTPLAYIKQMSAYKTLMEKIYPDKKIRCFILWTKAPKLTEITSLVCDTM